MIKVTTIIQIKNTVKKIVVVFSGILILMMVCIMPITGWFNVRAFSSNNQIPSYLRPYSNQLNRVIAPSSVTPIIADVHLRDPECRDLKIDKECYEQLTYRNAFQYVQQKIVNSIDLLEKDPDSIVKFIKKTNALLTQYKQKKPGELRTNNPFVVLKGGSTSKESLKKLFLDQGGLKQDIKIFESFYHKLDTYDKRILSQHLSPDELKVLQTTGYLVCDTDEIDIKLHNFANQIQALVKGVSTRSIDTIATAAFVHLELMRIHPFKDDNLETAKIWMDNMLLLGGFEAVTLPANEYKIAILKDIHDPGIFAGFLESVIASNRKYI